MENHVRVPTPIIVRTPPQIESNVIKSAELQSNKVFAEVKRPFDLPYTITRYGAKKANSPQSPQNPHGTHPTHQLSILVW